MNSKELWDNNSKKNYLYKYFLYDQWIMKFHWSKIDNESSEPSREPLVGNEPSQPLARLGLWSKTFGELNYKRANPLAPARLGSWHLSSARSWLACAALRASNKTLNKFKSIKSVAYIHTPWGVNDSFCMLQMFLRVKFAFDEHEHLIIYII